MTDLSPEVVGEKPAKCTVRDGRFVEPCWSLEANIENQFAAFSRGKGVTRWHYTNLTTHEPSREFYGIKSKKHPNGMLFNFCPWCGADISAPFMDEEEPARAQASGGAGE